MQARTKVWTVVWMLRPHPARELTQQAARPGDLVGLQALQRILQRLRRQQAGEPVDRRLRRPLSPIGALRSLFL